MSKRSLSLTNFEQQLVDLICRPTDMRPFVCDGSPLDCQVFLVGHNPATDMSADFWDFWTPQGFDQAGWFDEYKRERAARPLRPGQTQRNKVSPTRRMINKVVEGAGIPILETNVYAHPSKDKKSLDIFDSRPFEFLVETIQPKVIVAHGDDAQLAMKKIKTSAKVIPVKHFSRGWSYERAYAFGQEIRDRVE